MSPDLHASVISTSWEKGPVAKHLGIEILTHKALANLRLHLYDREPVAQLYGPFSAESLREAAKILNQAARLLETKSE